MLVRVQDRLTFSRESTAVWRRNPRTKFLESRAGLSWTGTRPYNVGGRTLRVLHRPSQFTAPGFVRTIKRLPAAAGHPDGDVDVIADNAVDLVCGYTGDVVEIETHDGYPRPVGNVVVTHPEVIGLIIDPQDPHTGTSLGYNAIWHGPYVEEEIVEETEFGYVAEWQGPNGPESYDVEHVVDPVCDIVQSLVRDAEFDADKLGGNHFAVALPAMAGRGAQQAELMRIVDSIELPIIGDRARKFGRVSVQVPKARDVKWTVGTDRDLTIVSGDWDGSAAAASVFDWATDADGNVDESKARRAFLVYDADEPALRGSYKLPIARYRDGELTVVDEGLRAAASRLPQTDIPKDVQDRARVVLDHYFDLLKARAASSKDTNVAQKNVDITVGRDNTAKLTKLGITPPASLSVVLDMMDADAIRNRVEELQRVMGELVGLLEDAVAEKDQMGEKMAAMERDAMSVEEAQKKVAEYETMLAEAKAALAEAQAASAEDAQKLSSKEKVIKGLNKANDALEAEVGPLRKAAFDQLQSDAVARGFDEAKVGACKDSDELKHYIAVSKSAKAKNKLGETFDATKVSDVRDAFEFVWENVPAPEAAPELGQSTLALLPQPRLAAPARDNSNLPDIDGDSLAASIDAW